MKTMQDFKNEESAKQYSLLKSQIGKPLGQILRDCKKLNKANIN
ncbi:hypothetical protein [uncultured phage cr106_1]|uniref:Uncharacterized protein n=1 Tax=uncultured phage cr106_1 TaxID=2772062 RepID=A0A7M1RWQ0_9CAUD|nr:hypothetical protein KNV29_gp096 [uncultured phage cr106_1]QOR58291.1 hypothetical protein [uncultured phage cr106_1]